MFGGRRITRPCFPNSQSRFHDVHRIPRSRWLPCREVTVLRETSRGWRDRCIGPSGYLGPYFSVGPGQPSINIERTAEGTRSRRPPRQLRTNARIGKPRIGKHLEHDAASSLHRRQAPLLWPELFQTFDDRPRSISLLGVESTQRGIRNPNDIHAGSNACP